MNNKTIEPIKENVDCQINKYKSISLDNKSENPQKSFVLSRIIKDKFKTNNQNPEKNKNININQAQNRSKNFNIISSSKDVIKSSNLQRENMVVLHPLKNEPFKMSKNIENNNFINSGINPNNLINNINKEKEPKYLSKKRIPHTRQENSLGELTKNFIQYIKDSGRDTININDLVKKLKVKKRRIYDITNVLEGIGYIKKHAKNEISWINTSTPPTPKGRGMEEIYNTSEGIYTNSNNNKNTYSKYGEFSIYQKQSYKKKLDSLEKENTDLDKKINIIKEHFNFLSSSNDFNRYGYITSLDLKMISDNENVDLIAIKAPKGTFVDIVDPKEAKQAYNKAYKSMKSGKIEKDEKLLETLKKEHHLFLDSQNGEISVYRLNDEAINFNNQVKNKVIINNNNFVSSNNMNFNSSSYKFNYNNNINSNSNYNFNSNSLTKSSMVSLNSSMDNNNMNNFFKDNNNTMLSKYNNEQNKFLLGENNNDKNSFNYSSPFRMSQNYQSNNNNLNMNMNNYSSKNDNFLEQQNKRRKQYNSIINQNLFKSDFNLKNEDNNIKNKISSSSVSIFSNTSNTGKVDSHEVIQEMKDIINKKNIMGNCSYFYGKGLSNISSFKSNSDKNPIDKNPIDQKNKDEQNIKNN